MTEIIKKIKQALADATPGPWEKWGSNGIHHVRQTDTRRCVADGVIRTYDAHVIANAPTWLASLITTLESQQREFEIQVADFESIVEEKDTLIESQKEEIERLRESLISLLPNVRGIEITIESSLSYTGRRKVN